MDAALKQWHPTPEEVERIVAEMRPLIAAMAAAQQPAVRTVRRKRPRRPRRSRCE